MAWEYTFPEIDFQDWIDQVKKDLKGKPIDSVSSLWWQGETLDPILTQNPADAVECRLPDIWFETPPRISEWIETKHVSPSDVNIRVMDALNYGAQRIITPIHDATQDEMQAWMQGVYLDMVEWELNASHTEAKKIHDLSTLQAFVSRSFLPEDFHREGSLHSGLDTPDVLSVIHMDHQPDWIAKCKMSFKKIADETGKFSSLSEQKKWLREIRFALDMPSDYFKGVVMLRSIQLAWLNLYKTLTGDTVMPASPVIAVITRGEPEKEDRFMIRASASALGASLAGVRDVMIRVNSPGPQQSMYARVGRNIHHLLHLESGLPKKEDPLAGAYALDFYTRKWATDILG